MSTCTAWAWAPSRRRTSRTSSTSRCVAASLLRCSLIFAFRVERAPPVCLTGGGVRGCQDPYFHGWDARHDMELERALLRILSSGSWSTPLTAGLGNMQWHNPLEGFKPGKTSLNPSAHTPCHATRHAHPRPPHRTSCHSCPHRCGLCLGVGVSTGANDGLVAASPCTSGIHC